MTPDPSDPAGTDRLAALFDETAPPRDDLAEARLHERSRERAARRIALRRVRRTLLWPAALAAAAAVTYLVLADPVAGPAGGASAPVASLVRPDPTLSPAEVAQAEPAATSGSELEGDPGADALLLADLGGDEEDPFDLSPLELLDNAHAAAGMQGVPPQEFP